MRSASTISARATPRPRWLTRVIILAISPRCGWFGGQSRCKVTVPTSSPSSSAPSTTRPPASAAASDLVQNAAATSGSSGCMKLTEPPWATVSIRVSLSAAMTSGVARRATISSIFLLAPGDDDQVGGGRIGFIGERSVGWRAKAQAVACFQFMAGARLLDDELALEHPDHLTDAGVRDRRHAHLRPGG